MVKLADTPDLGSGERSCRFKSCQAHHLLWLSALYHGRPLFLYYVGFYHPSLVLSLFIFGCHFASVLTHVVVEMVVIVVANAITSRHTRVLLNHPFSSNCQWYPPAVFVTPLQHELIALIDIWYFSEALVIDINSSPVSAFLTIFLLLH